MPRRSQVQTRVIGFRVSDDEYEEISTYLSRAGIGQSDLVRSAVLDRVRGSTAFVDLLPNLTASVERDLSALGRQLSHHTALMQTLAAASIASAALLKDDGKSPVEVSEQQVEDTIERSIRAAPLVVQRCLDVHPALAEPRSS